MGLSSDLVSQDLGTSNSFNWPWFIELFVCGILVLFFLFYFNRLFATIVSKLLCLYTWSAFRVWIDIQAIQISLLGGRIFFKGIRYYGENETILVQSGHITWRYWLRDVRQVDLTRVDEPSPQAKQNGYAEKDSYEGADQQGKDEELGSIPKAKSSQARVAVSVSGVEWFIYNRTPLYDAILRESGSSDTSCGADVKSNLRDPIKPTDKVKLPTMLRRRPGHSASSPNGPPRDVVSTTVKETETHAPETQSSDCAKTDSKASQDDVTFAQSLLVQMLPIYVECNRAAVAMGNDNTQALLVTTVSRAKGHIDASGCSHHDMFRQLFDFEIEHPVIQMRPNPDFKSSQMDTAERVVSEGLNMPKKRPWWRPHFNVRYHRDELMSSIYGHLPWLRLSTQSLHHGHHASSTGHSARTSQYMGKAGRQWQGLGRYLDDSESDDHQAWAEIEYGRFSTVLDCPSVHLNFFWDVPGRVKAQHVHQWSSSSARDINGVTPPSYGLDLVIRGGDINYGPWTDRLRAELQAMFLPASYRSATPASPLAVGDWRQSTKMLIRVDVEDEVTLRVPTREMSKDWRWRGRATAVRDAAALRKQHEKRHFRFRKGQKSVAGPDIRPFGWLSFSVAADSSVRYEMDMVAGISGYSNRLQLDLKETKASSSANHSLLWKCGTQRLDCDLSNPLRWNGPHEWIFNIDSTSMQLFLLRDHMFLLTDLISDFTAGQKSDYMTFVPFTYKLNLKFVDLQLMLNANDLNIIDDPVDIDNNTFLILGIRSLLGEVQIPMQNFAPAQNSVSFDARGEDLYLKLSTPVWNTLHNFSRDDIMATLETLRLDGSYNYCTATSPLLTDALLMNITGLQPKFYLQGFLIRYFINVKENYFGDFLHYKTLEEHQANMIAGRPAIEIKKPQAKKDNDIDVVLSIRAVESCIMMPAHIYDRSESLRVDVMNVDMDMRFTNYYMDMLVASSPIEATIEKRHDSDKDGSELETGNPQLHIDHVTVFGHRLFGAPPVEPAYVCNWDIDVGNIVGECSADFLQVSIAAVESLIYTLEDDQNALKVSGSAAVHDVTFLRAQTAGLRIWLRHQNIAFLVEVAPFDVVFNDWADELFSKRLKTFIPNILFAAVDTSKPHRYDERQGERATTIACLQTSVHVATLDKVGDHMRNRNLQQHHIWFHDLKDSRARPLLNHAEPWKTVEDDVSWGKIPANIPVPDLPARLLSHPSGRGSNRVSKRASKRVEESILTGEEHRPPANGTLKSDSPTAAVLKWANANRIEEQMGSSRSFGTNDKVLSKANFSSAWNPPYFSLSAVQPNIDDLPTLEAGTGANDMNDDISLDGRDIPEQHPSMAHGSTMVRFPSGLRGFFDSELFSHVFQLMVSIKDHNPVAVFDSIERKTIGTILQGSSTRSDQVSDVAIYLPAIALRLSDNAPSADGVRQLLDQYDFRASGAQMILRTAPTAAKHSDGRTRKDVITSQVSIQNILLSINERSTKHSTVAATLTVSLCDVSMWLSLQDQIRTSLKIGDFETVTSSTSVDRLAPLFQRSSGMIERVQAEAAHLGKTAYEQNLVQQLVMPKRKATDPSFLSRPSSVLRTAENHVRQHSSWRALVILRHRLQQFSQSQLEEATISKSHSSIHPDLRGVILDSVGAYYAGIPSADSYQPLFSSILGVPVDGSALTDKADDIQVRVFVDQISLILDPGPRKSEVSLGGCDLEFSTSPILEKGLSAIKRGKQRAKTVVRSWFSGIHIDLNWELVELAKILLDRTQQDTPVTSKETSAVPASKQSTPSNLDLTVVCGTDKAMISLRTTNLTVAMGAEDFKSSVTFLQSVNHSFSTMLLASTSAYTKITSHATKLMHTSILTPTIYVAHQRHSAEGSGPDVVQIAAVCSQLRFNMLEAPLGLVQVANLLLAEEITAVQDVINLAEARAGKASLKDTESHQKLPRLRLGLFLKDYKIQIALLPNIQYLISGKVARTSIIPLADSKFAIHIDLKRNLHTLLAPSMSHSKAISILECPPISGRVVVAVKRSEIKLTARSVIEKITIEASAVEACLEAVYNTKNAEYLRAIGMAIEDCKETIKDGTAFHKVRHETKDIRAGALRFSFSAHLALAGILLNCSAPIRQGQSNSANLTLDVRSISVNVRKTKLAEYPDFKIRAPSIGLYLYRNTSIERRHAGKFSMGLMVVSTQETDRNGMATQAFRVQVSGIDLDLFTETPAVAVDIATYIQEQLRSAPADDNPSQMQPLKRLTIAHNEIKRLRRSRKVEDSSKDQTMESSTILQNSILMLEFNAIRIRWILDDATPLSPSKRIEDLIFSIRKIDLTTQREDSARLTILDLQIQLVPKGQSDPTERTRNSALLPEVVFKAAHVSTRKERRFAFQAAGKALDLRLAADGILPLSAVQKSLEKANTQLRALQQKSDDSSSEAPASISTLLGNKRLSSLLVDADFAGAVLTVTPRVETSQTTAFGLLKGPKRSRAGRYGQAVQSNHTDDAVLRAPGIAVKVEYQDTDRADPSFNMEVKVAASNNTLAPTVVPLVLDIYSSVKEIIGEDDDDLSASDIRAPAQKYLSGAANAETDPTMVLGRVRLNASLWVQRQEFSLTCQPVARVQATTSFDDIFMTVNTVQNDDKDRFVSILTKFNHLQASVQHIYSRESTAGFEVESIVMSLMNSKHVSTKNGISAILTISPMSTSINARQLQDFLLFREIWYPQEIRRTSKAPAPSNSMSESQTYAMQKYQELTATAALPWHAVVSVQEVKLQVDFGQALGKSSFTITNLWASSKKSSDWEQNLCVGFDRVGIDSVGRMSGFVELEGFRGRTSIRWPISNSSGARAPLVQASLGFDHLRLKAAFDYQPFAVADVSSFEFLMYNVRPQYQHESDRLVGILDGGKVQAFCISTAASQVLAIIQAFQRLFQEKRDAYQASLHEVERLLRRKSVYPGDSSMSASMELERPTPTISKSSHTLHTDVVVTLKAIDIGAFPSTFFDSQILKIQAANAQARFAVATVDSKIRSGLGMSLGQVRLALSSVGRSNTKALGEVEISDVIERATGSRGGTIMKVPKLVASMQTWQQEQSNLIEYIFRSTFHGKVDVGWNYSRISYIRSMWDTHSGAMAQRLGKPLAPSAVKITAEDAEGDSGQEKITAVVNMPQSSKYEYVALEPPIIDTPQLRDMGEATPPLEWIGLHRDKLPNVAHSIIIVTLLEVAREVEDAYTRILGTG